MGNTSDAIEGQTDAGGRFGLHTGKRHHFAAVKVATFITVSADGSICDDLRQSRGTILKRRGKSRSVSAGAATGNSRWIESNGQEPCVRRHRLIILLLVGMSPAQLLSCPRSNRCAHYETTATWC